MTTVGEKHFFFARERTVDERQRPTIMASSPAWLWRLGFFLLFAWLGAGGCTGRKSGPRDAPAAAEGSVVSRVILPPHGGQTIAAPRFIADAQKLWSPLGVAGAVVVPAVGREFFLHWPSGYLGSKEREAADRYFYRLAGTYRGTTERVLRRASGHMPVLLEGLRRRGLPLELACLPLVESAFENQAVSRAGAAGLWQLMPDTARRYGLEVSAERDERFDVVKATTAAAAYLYFLYGHFGDWPLALAAYNCGEGAMRRALARTGGASLAELLERNSRLPREERVLQEETVQYVPKFAAAVAAMMRGRELGLSVEPLLPESYASPESAAMPPLQSARRPERQELRRRGHSPPGIPVLPRITRAR